MSVDTDSDTTTPTAVLVSSHCGGGQERPYHTAECRYVRHHGDSMREWERETAEAWGLKECRRCAGRADG